MIMLARNSEWRPPQTISRAEVRDLLPKLIDLIGAHIDVVMAREGSGEEVKARKRRNSLANSLSLDERRMAAMFVQSIGIVINYW
jgi:hypothetical protein